MNKLVPIRARAFAEKSVIRSKSDRFAAFRLFLEPHLIFKKRRGLSGCHFGSSIQIGKFVCYPEQTE